jgi:hypothetical protein
MKVRSARLIGFAISSVLLMACGAPAVAQRAPRRAAPKAAARRQAPSPPASLRELAGPADPRIAAMVREVSPARLKEIDLKLVSFGTRQTLSDPANPTRGIGAARNWIKAEFERYSQACGGCLEVEMQSFTLGPAPRIPQPTEIVNVVATLRGSDPENAKRIYVMSGHYDTICSDDGYMSTKCNAPGANDDGSGTSAVLEAARVLSRHKFPATIIFVAFAGEEQGLDGSHYFAEQARKNGWDIQGDLNNDIVGGNHTPGDIDPQQGLVRLFSEGVPDTLVRQDTPEARARLRLLRGTGGENDSPSRELARYIRDTGLVYVPQQALQAKLIFRPDRYLRGGDQTSFLEQGYPAVRFTEFREDYHHQHQTPRTEDGIEYGDLPKFVDYAYLANVTRINVAALASLASAPAPPANVQLLTRKLENDSTLTWDPSPGGLAASYEVVWRATDRPEWENVFPAGDATTATLDRSKDNVFFGVRAVDKQGHRSVPVIPTPER